MKKAMFRMGEHLFSETAKIKTIGVITRGELLTEEEEKELEHLDVVLFDLEDKPSRTYYDRLMAFSMYISYQAHIAQ